MDNFKEIVSSMRTVSELFIMMDEYHKRQLYDAEMRCNKAEFEHSRYIEEAQKSQEEMGENYDYHNYDYGIDQELLFEVMGREHELQYYKEINELIKFSLFEMKILFLYKEVEIRLKSIISKKYQKSTKNLSSLKCIKNYFANKGIGVDSIKNYTIIDQLRRVSNDLKHSGEIKDSKDIVEFKGSSKFNFISLKKFMDGKVDEVENFLENLVLLVFKN